MLEVLRSTSSFHPECDRANCIALVEVPIRCGVDAFLGDDLVFCPQLTE